MNISIDRYWRDKNCVSRSAVRLTITMLLLSTATRTRMRVKTGSWISCRGADNLRLLCRVHNQFMAEEVIGTKYLEAAKAKCILTRDCTLALTTLGFSKTVAKAAVARLTIKQNSSLAEVMRAALQAVERPRT